MRIAIIDLGTNTFKLLIVEPKEDGFEIVQSSKSPVMLGEEGLRDDMIAAKAFKRGTEALRHFNLIIEEYKCDRVHAFATSAIRSAKNGNDFVDSVKRKLGIHIDVIDGQREAELIFRGINRAISVKDNVLMMDIGGGSTEMIIANQGEVLWAHSFDLGVSRLFQTLTPSDPLTPNEVVKISEALNAELQLLDEALNQHPVSHLAGSSGSFTTFAKMIAHKRGTEHPYNDQSEFLIEASEWNFIHEKLLGSTHQERLNMPGIEPFRAQYIVMGAILTNLVLDKAAVTTIRTSEFNMKEGAIIEALNL